MIIKTLLIAAMLSLSLITPSFADQPAEKEVDRTITREESMKQLAKDLASLMYLLESFGKEVEKELDRKRKEDK